jgi:hypothetical protein
VGMVEDVKKAFKGVSKCDLERVVVTRPESVADRREVVRHGRRHEKLR